MIRNIIIVWVLTGFWHGADWGFILWGCYFGIIILIEKFFILKKLENMKIFNRIYVALIIIIGFVIFNSEKIDNIKQNLGGLIGIGGIPLVSKEFIYYFRSYILTLIISFVGATPVPKKLVNKVRSAKKGNIVINILEPFVLFTILILVTAYLVDGSFNPFLYFRF
jgi:alginate O-acetyltransferase complex protein AlgI